MSNFATEDLTAFYDALSAHVQGDAAHDGGADAMHRALRDPATPSQPPSPHVLNRLIAQHVSEGAHVLDAGCGWGGTLFHLALNQGARGLGVTLSAVQHAYAQARAQTLGVEDRLHFLLGDYNTIEIAPSGFDWIVMVETVHHNRNPLATVSRLAGFLSPTGRILLVDDFARSGLPDEDPRVRAFVSGWRFSRFWTVDAFVDALTALGFSARMSRDLTPLTAPRADAETAALIQQADAELAELRDDQLEQRLALEALRGGYVLEQLYAGGDAVYAMIEIDGPPRR